VRVPYLENGKGWAPMEKVIAQNTQGVPVLSVEGAPVEQVTVIPAVAQAVTDVNIRAGPGLSYEKVGMLKNGQSAEILGTDPQSFWWYVSVPEVEGLQGWVAIDYVIARNAEEVPVIDPEAEKLARIPPTPGIGAPSLVALATVNFRSGPGKNFGVLGALEQDQRAEVVGVNEDGTWWAIKFPAGQNGIAWVSANYVKAENTQELPVMK
jgi:N-acetylmuramoyl-L-alanine amidase